MSRKPIQITFCDEHLFALCDDGTIWARPFAGKWTKVEDVPQDQRDAIGGYQPICAETPGARPPRER